MPLPIAQSIPWAMSLSQPVPELPSTFTAWRETAGATPTTPMLLSSAAAMPLVQVPWPFLSSHRAGSVLPSENQPAKLTPPA